jgi:predicted permease
MRPLFDEIRYALRGFLNSPVWTAAALLSLALGIGANTAIFSLTDQLLLRSLPVRQPEQLVLFSAKGPRRGMVETSYDNDVSFSYPMFCDFRDRAPALNGVLARFPLRLSMSWGGQTELVQGDLVTGGYFDVLGVRAAMGRTLSPEDDLPGHTNEVAVLSHKFWKSRFGAAASILNQTVRLNGLSLTVVGVAQEGFNGVGTGEAPDVFVPMTLQPRISRTFDGLPNRRAYWLNIFARVKEGTRVEQAEAVLNGFWRPILEQEVKETPNASEQFRERFVTRRLTLLPGARGISSVREQAAGPLTVLMCMVGLLLLITCANVANLLIARAAGRRREIAIRLAIGAGQSRLVRQLLIEGLLLSVAGALLGILLSAWTAEMLMTYLPDDPSLKGISAAADPRVLGFGMLLALATGLFFGLAPAWETFRVDVSGTLKEQTGNLMGSASQVRFRKALVIAQVGLSLVLLIGSGLFARSLFNLKQVDPGFRADHLLAFTIQPALNGYDQPRIRSLYETLYERISSTPRVRGVAMAEIPVLTRSDEVSTMEVPGYQPQEGESMGLRHNWVGPGYFSAMGIPLVKGREITGQDGPDSPRVVVINQKMAEKYFGGGDALGRRFWLSKDRTGAGIEVVGIVKGSKHSDLREESQPFAHFPYPQHDSLQGMTIYTRTSEDAASFGAVLRAQVRDADPNLPVFDMKTLARQIDESVFAERIVAVLSTYFGALATILAAIGLYGVMAYAVGRRTREIGLRMALGAARSEVVGMVMHEVALLAAIGFVIAVPVAYGLSRLVQSQLYNVRADDPAVFAAAMLVLGAVIAAAGMIPALRATRIDPMTALRNE